MGDRLDKLRETFDELRDSLSVGDVDTARLRLELLRWQVFQDLQLAADVFTRVLECKAECRKRGEAPTRIRVHPDTMPIIFDAVKAVYDHEVVGPLRSKLMIYDLPVEVDDEVLVGHVEIDGYTKNRDG